ncbi:MAG: hypothetical protein FD177_1601 [Desulfovibrionaceae bacterium]|nr:MAG: hypothetical protein FD177_1601 [Desulfovibrionaceae bacterium]
MSSKNNDKSGGNKKQSKGNMQEAGRGSAKDSKPEEAGSSDAAMGSREKKLAKLAQRKK